IWFAGRDGAIVSARGLFFFGFSEVFGIEVNFVGGVAVEFETADVTGEQGDGGRARVREGRGGAGGGRGSVVGGEGEDRLEGGVRGGGQRARARDVQGGGGMFVGLVGGQPVIAFAGGTADVAGAQGDGAVLSGGPAR